MPLKKDLEMYVQWPHLETALEIGEVEYPITSGHSAGKDSEILSDGITSSKVGQLVEVPSAQVLHKLHELGGLSQAHWMLKEDVEQLKVGILLIVLQNLLWEEQNLIWKEHLEQVVLSFCDVAHCSMFI